MTKKLAGMKVTILKDGPYLVTGRVPLSKQSIGSNAKGESLRWEQGKKYPDQEEYSLCRCGGSAGKPYCDGTHAVEGFDGTETASREPYESQADAIDGPTLVLTDQENLCAFARFCDPKGRVWNRVQTAADPESRKVVEQEAGDCPGGRLVAWDKATGKALEPHFEASIGLIEDPVQGCSGPIWVRGGIAIEAADGFAYETRNRVALCRCGQSSNKPYCDGTHASFKFQGDE
jgi:CDGSH-type Zn-finger protein